MKKVLSIFLVVVMLLSLSMIISAEEAQYSESKRSVYLDGAYIDVENIVVDDIELLPIKELCSILGYEIKEISQNTFEITEGENCKNAESTMGKAVFTVGNDYFTTYSKDGNYENKTEMFPSASMTIELNDELYIPSYYFGRMFDIRTRFTEDMKIALFTVNYQKEQAENAPEYSGHIFVKKFDNELRLELDGKEMAFTDKPFIDADGRTQIPVREFCEQVGCSVTWLPDIQKVLVSTVTVEESKINGGAGGDNFSFIIGKRQYAINGTQYDMDTEAQIINNRTYVPLRYLAEAMNYYVAYNPTSPSKLDMGYGPSVMNSYLGLSKELVMDEMDIDESNQLKVGNEAYPVREHQEGTMYIVKNGYKKGHVVIEFYNDVLCAFQYVFKTEGEAFDEALSIYDYLVKLYGEAATYSGTEKTIAKIKPDESQVNDEVCSYYDEWHIDASNELIESMIGDADNALMKMLKLEINPQLSTVRVNFSKDVNFHNRSVFKIMDKDNNYIITDGDVLSCYVVQHKQLIDKPDLSDPLPDLQLTITQEARNDFKEATKRISEYPGGENYVKVIVDGVEISRPSVVTEMDTNVIMIAGAASDWEEFNSYVEKINEAIK